MPTTSLRQVSILGSTGSIGRQALDIIQRNQDSFSLRWITCNTKWQDLAECVRTYRPYGVALQEEDAWKAFKNEVPEFNGPVLCGQQGICDAAADADNDVVLSAMVGFSGVLPTLAAIRVGHIIGLANKESLVSAGSIIIEAASSHNATLIAIDSEHSAILQCLLGERVVDVERFIITASGGPFRNLSAEEMKVVTPAMALKHPNWTMGSKITIDSATLMNKGFEVIEARWLFDVPGEKIDVLIHPQSIVHSMVEFVDGSVKAQMGLPTMLVPIQYALTYPHRKPLATERLDLAAIGQLTFEAPDTERFPCLRIAFEALEVGGSAGAVVNAANEIAVAAFLDGRIAFADISATIENTLEHMEHASHPSIDHIVAIDAESRRIAVDFTLTC